MNINFEKILARTNENMNLHIKIDEDSELAQAIYGIAASAAVEALKAYHEQIHEDTE